MSSCDVVVDCLDSCCGCVSIGSFGFAVLERAKLGNEAVVKIFPFILIDINPMGQGMEVGWINFHTLA